MNNFDELVRLHKVANENERHLRREADELRIKALSEPSGVSFQLRAKADRCLNRAFGASMRASDIEDDLCKMAEKDERALQYMTDYYDNLGLLPK